jgi:Ca2+-binding EF-hand superfamily protein
MCSIEDILKNEELLDKISDASFAQADKDKSGSISVDELATLMKEFAKELEIKAPTDEEIKESFKAIDTDGSNTISKAEFKILVKEILNLMK